MSVLVFFSLDVEIPSEWVCIETWQYVILIFNGAFDFIHGLNPLKQGNGEILNLVNVEINDTKVRDILECLRSEACKVKNIVLSYHQFSNMETEYFRLLWDYLVPRYDLYVLNCVTPDDAIETIEKECNSYSFELCFRHFTLK